MKEAGDVIISPFKPSLFLGYLEHIWKKLHGDVIINKNYSIWEPIDGYCSANGVNRVVMNISHWTQNHLLLIYTALDLANILSEIVPKL